MRFGLVLAIASALITVVALVAWPSTSPGGETAAAIADHIKEREGCEADRELVDSDQYDGIYPQLTRTTTEIVDIDCEGKIPPGSTLWRYETSSERIRASKTVDRNAAKRLCQLDDEIFYAVGFYGGSRVCRELGGAVERGR